jgi:ABC-type branched-subunit amino acid transport system substrate-binding protein
MLAVLAATGLAAVAILQTGIAQAKSKTILVDWIYDQTGALQPVNYPDGVLANVDRVNAAGGINGYKIVLKKYDGQSTAAGTLNAARRAIGDHPAAVILQSILGYTAVPALQAAGIPTVGWGAVPGESTAANSDFFSATGDIATHNSDAWIQALTTRGLKKIALVSGTLEKPDIDLLQKLAPADGAQVVYFNDGLPSLVDAPTQLSIAQAIQQSGAQGVVIFGCTNCQTIAVDLNQLGAKVTTIQTSAFGPAVIKQYGGSANGMAFSIVMANPYITGDPGVTAYRAAMEKYGFKAQEYTPYAITFYAATQMLIDGLKKAGPTASNAKLIAAMNGFKNYTAGGLIPNATFGSGPNSWHVVGSNCLSSAQITNGKWVSLNNGKTPWVCSHSGQVSTASG